MPTEGELHAILSFNNMLSMRWTYKRSTYLYNNLLLLCSVLSFSKTLSRRYLYTTNTPQWHRDNQVAKKHLVLNLDSSLFLLKVFHKFENKSCSNSSPPTWFHHDAFNLPPGNEPAMYRPQNMHTPPSRFTIVKSLREPLSSTGTPVTFHRNIRRVCDTYIPCETCMRQSERSNIRQSVAHQDTPEENNDHLLLLLVYVQHYGLGITKKISTAHETFFFFFRTNTLHPLHSPSANPSHGRRFSSCEPGPRSD